MSIVAKLHGIPQLRCLPSAGGRGSTEPLRYVLNVPGCSEEVNHSFVEWAVGEARRQSEAAKCEISIARSQINAALSSGSFVGSRRAIGLSTSVLAMSTTNALAHSISFSVISEK